jgi:hypothetical protein
MTSTPAAIEGMTILYIDRTESYESGIPVGYYYVTDDMDAPEGPYATHDEAETAYRMADTIKPVVAWSGRSRSRRPFLVESGR